MRIKVFCRRPVLIAHRHPSISTIACVAHRPWLGETHEHSVVVTVWAWSHNVERDVDLLLLQDKLEKLVAPKMLSFMSYSFEGIAEWFMREMRMAFPTVCAVQIDAGHEGAIVERDHEEGAL